ncbi:MAG: hypothetical protein J6T62_05965 [Fibrobacter sp.]|nr:hypothetical protein [Fibrobacter sp.]
MEKKITTSEPACKKDYVAPEMKVEVLRLRCNLLEASLPNEIGVIINSDSGSN